MHSKKWDRKQEDQAWVVWKFFEVVTEQVKYNKADVTKQNAEYMLPVNT